MPVSLIILLPYLFSPTMFERLKEKWGVSGWRFALIFIIFALGGSLTGYAGRKLMGLTAIESNAVFIPVYIVLVTILWPFCVLLVSLPLGQFPFFWAYIRKLGRRIAGKK